MHTIRYPVTANRGAKSVTIVDGVGRTICECPDAENAEEIADVLNTVAEIMDNPGEGKRWDTAAEVIRNVRALP